MEQKRVYRLVLTGGPCGGKTTGQSRLCTFFENLGWNVFRVPETATVLLSGGIKFHDLSPEARLQFQGNLLKTMVQLENTYFELAANWPRDTLIICDRGAMDASAFISPEQWQHILDSNCWNNVELRDNRYHHVIHMVSAAHGAEEFYSLEEHVCRSEGVNLARTLDSKAAAAWVGHPYYDVIDNSTDFESKIHRMIECVCRHLGVDPGDRLRSSSRKIQPKLEEWVTKVQSNWSPIAQTITKPWLRDGLKQRCITRDLKWGIPVPLDGFRDKVFYVWFDAPLGYVSITKKYHKEYQKWWTKSDDYDVDLYQFMAKDNVPFHAIMFPATLLAADLGMIMVKHIMAIEYLNYEDTKFSKSRGIGVFGDDAQKSDIDVDVYRFYLAYIRPETQDSNFNWEDLATKNNSELLNNLGNFVNRALMFCSKNFDSKIPQLHLQEDDLTLIALVQRELTSYINLMEQVRMRDALKHVLSISKHGNQYMQAQQPWVKIKGTDEDKKKAGTVVGLCSNIACLLSLLIGPYMPKSALELRRQLGLDRDRKLSYGHIPTVFSCLLPAGHVIREPKPLFKKIEDATVVDLRNRFAGKQGSQEPEQKPKKETGKNKETAEKAPEMNGGSATDVAAMEDMIAKQGDRVRTLKATGDESKWKPEVTILLQLKQKLAELTGVPLPKKGGSKKKK